MSIASQLGSLVGGKSSNVLTTQGTHRVNDGSIIQVSRDRKAELSSGIVKDRLGRERFHGAFAGGWSAGYFNTVGSKEGWTPSTFTSSRSTQTRRQQTPEDFMDAEDKATLLGAHLTAAPKFTGTGTTEDNQYSETSGQTSTFNIGANVWSQLTAVPDSSHIGHHLLIKMGWRPGRSIGTRVKYKSVREKKSKDRTQYVSFGRLGLGYSSELRQQQPSSAIIINNSTNQQLDTREFNRPQSNRMFMVDTLSGDSSAKRTSYMNDEYDQELEYDIPDTIEHAIQEKKHRQQQESSPPISKRELRAAELAHGLKCHDGVPALPGFHLGTSMSQFDPIPPESKLKVPKHFNRHHEHSATALHNVTLRKELLSQYVRKAMHHKMRSEAMSKSSKKDLKPAPDPPAFVAALSDRFVSAGNMKKADQETEDKKVQQEKVQTEHQNFENFLALKPDRKVITWCPVKVLCKRMGVKPPVHAVAANNPRSISGKVTDQTSHNIATTADEQARIPPTNDGEGSFVPEHVKPGYRPPPDLLSAVFNVENENSLDDSDTETSSDEEITASTDGRTAEASSDVTVKEQANDVKHMIGPSKPLPEDLAKLRELHSSGYESSKSHERSRHHKKAKKVKKHKHKHSHSRKSSKHKRHRETEF